MFGFKNKTKIELKELETTKLETKNNKKHKGHFQSTKWNACSEGIASISGNVQWLKEI